MTSIRFSIALGGASLAVAAIEAARAVSRRCRLRAEADELLALGARPASEWLRLRAAELTRRSMREALARSLRRAVRQAARPPEPGGSVINRPGVLAERDRILLLAARIDRLERPVDPSGMARVMRLLGSESSPLYGPASGEELRARVVDAIEALEQDGTARRTGP